jgi:hypothetical protein
VQGSLVSNETRSTTQGRLSPLEFIKIIDVKEGDVLFKENQLHSPSQAEEKHEESNKNFIMRQRLLLGLYNHCVKVAFDTPFHTLSS